MCWSCLLLVPWEGHNLPQAATTYVGPQASQMKGQLWDFAVLEQWPTVIRTPSLWAAHMALAGHDMGTEFIWQLLSESQKV